MSDKQQNSWQAPANAAILRKQAEEQARDMEPISLSAQPPEAIQQMLHELQVHQIQLEMQNEELRRAKVQIEAWEARYHDLYDLSPVGYCTISEKALILEANRTAATLLGLARNTLINQPLSCFILKDDQDTDYLHRKQLFETGDPQEFDLQMVKPDGALFWAHLKVTRTQALDGSPLCLAVISDITRRKEVEEQLFTSKATLATVLDGISDPIIILDAELRIKRLNKAAKHYYGLASYDQAIGKYCFEGFRGRTIPCEGCERPFSSMHGYSGSYERNEVMDPNRLSQVVVDMVSNELGVTEATIIRLHDITQTRMMDRQLIQSNQLATLGLLIAGIAHEINNPNNFIFFNTPILRSYLEFLLPIVDEYVEAHPDLQVFNRPYSAFREDCFKLLINIEHGSIRINQIVSNLKEFVREREKGEFRRIDLKQVVEKGLNLCQGRIRKTVKTFEVDIPEGLPTLYSDPLAIEQVVVNLLVNAIQASDKEDSWVRLRINVPDKPNGEVMIEVSDNGCGMDIATQRKIFDPFFTTKAAGIGTGLGLSITHRLLEELGGRIEVKSIVGEGSVFLVRLNTRATPLKPLKTG